LGAEGDEVEVEGARFVEELLWAAAELTFQFLEAGEEGFGGFVRTGEESNDGVEERG
jgi:hypothetical protein